MAHAPAAADGSAKERQTMTIDTTNTTKANAITNSPIRANALTKRTIAPDAATTGADTDPTDGQPDCPTDAPDHRAVVARTIGEALRLAGAIEAMGVERVVAGTDAEYDLTVRLHDLTERLACHADGGDPAAALVRRHLAPLVTRLEAAAMDEALATANALVGRGGIGRRFGVRPPR